MLPNLIVIGAGRCGTTSLHRYLDLHPEIAMSSPKELNFFSADSSWNRGLAWYEAQFDPSAPVRGESSPSYAAAPVYPDATARLARTVPEARLIYLVRDPLERSLSAYRFRRYVLGHETRDLTEAVADLAMSRYVSLSRYAFQLERYLVHYSPDRILVLEQGDLWARRDETLRRVFAFVGVDENFTAPEFARTHNPTEGLRANRGGRAAIRALDALIGPSRSAAVRARIPLELTRPLLSRSRVPPTNLDPGLRNEIEAILSEDANRLRQLTGQEFAHWCV
jgi:hypothetical protein